MKQEINIGIAGLGVVGGGVYEILTQEIERLNKRSHKQINLVATGSRSKKDFVDESKVKFYENTLDLADDENVDVVVELIGGSEGIAYELSKKSLSNKKHFVTANKALIATHGIELSELAAKNNVSLCFESAVAGAIPVLKTIREGLVANEVSEIYAILNGTCNYILTKMEENNVDFDVVLKEAQELGYAESDPTFDIEGIDSAHKLAILAALAKNSKIDFDALYIEGITKISIEDIHFANEFGYKIKSLGIYKSLENGEIRQSVYPCLINKEEKIANINDSYNAVLSKGSNSDWNFQVGRGAGASPTASAVVADILEIANGTNNFPFGTDVNDLIKVKTANISQREGKYYLRFNVEKEFAKEDNFISQIFNSEEAIEKSIIKEISEDKLVYALTIKEITEGKMSEYLVKIKETSQIDNINMIRIEKISGGF